MKIVKIYFLMAITLLLTNITACSMSPIVRTKSSFDNVEKLSLEPRPLSMGASIKMGIIWDETMKDKYKDAYKNLGILVINGKRTAANDTTVNINIDGAKHILNVLDIDKQNNNVREYSADLFTAGQLTNKDEMYVHFIISDKLLENISKSNNTILMVNLANGSRVENSIDFTMKSDFNMMLYEKQKNKIAYPQLNR